MADQLNRFVILDEIHRAPGLFSVLRGLIDRVQAIPLSKLARMLAQASP